MFENRNGDAVCTISRAKISEVFYFCVYCLLVIEMHVLVSNGPITCYLLHNCELSIV